jgi:hypothetical protein
MMIYASIYLLYSPGDQFLAQWTAQELGKRGIITWNDPQKTDSYEEISSSVKEMLARQAALVIFISPQAMADSRYKEVITTALALYNDAGATQRIIPLYILDPEPVEPEASQPIQLSQWLHSYWEKVKGEQFISSYDTNNVSRAREIASQVSSKIYRLLKIREQKDVVIYLDQRGAGARQGLPHNVPGDIDALEIPALVFRPNLKQRSQYETLYGEEWNELRLSLKESFEQAFGGILWPQPKKLHLLGETQLGIPFITGLYFNRNSKANLYCQNREGILFTNRNQRRFTPLEGGNPHCTTSHDKIKPIHVGANIKTLSLLLFRKEKYVTDVWKYLKEQTGDTQPPMLWVQHDEFKNNKQVMSYIGDIVALLNDLKNRHDELSTILLFCGLPISVIPLLAANLLNVVENVIFMEYRKDLQGKGVAAGEFYVPLRTGSGEIDLIPTVNLSEHRPKIKILFLAVNPDTTRRLHLDREIKKIQTNLKTCKEKDNLELKQEWAISMENLMQALLDEPPDIVHFAGHGKGEGIVLQDDGDFPKIITGEALKCLFKEFKDKIKCVILNACYSEQQAQVLKSYIPFVIGMKSEIHNSAAIAFSTGFYQALGAGKSIPTAFNFGLSAIKGEVQKSKDIAVLL